MFTNVFIREFALIIPISIAGNPRSWRIYYQGESRKLKKNGVRRQLMNDHPPRKFKILVLWDAIFESICEVKVEAPERNDFLGIN